MLLSCNANNANEENNNLYLPSRFIECMVKAKTFINDESLKRYQNDCFDLSANYTLDAASIIDSFTLDEEWVASNFASKDEYNEFVENVYEQELRLFSKGMGFNLYDRESYRPKLCAGFYKNEDIFSPTMYISYSGLAELSTIELGQLSIIEFGDVYGYQHNFWIANPDLDFFFCFLYLLTYMNEQDIPFEIYVWTSDDEKIIKAFLISKNDIFKSKCIDKIENEPGMQRYNIQQARIIIEKAENS